MLPGMSGLSRRESAAAVVAAVLVLGLGACSGDGKPDRPSATATATATATVDRAAAREACKEAWRQGLEDGTVADGQVPADCEGVPDSAKLGAEALLERNKANRDRLDDCLADPSCTEMPIP
jgi:hypothetical protein